MNNNIKRILECMFIFVFVGTLYFIIECVYKQRLSHWSMFVLAGFVGLIAMLLNDKFTYEMDILLQLGICTTLTTILEYFVGITLNFDYSIWDYRESFMNLDGQICLPFTGIWFCLFGILIPLLDYIEWKVFKYKEDTPPYYKLFGKVVLQFK